MWNGRSHLVVGAAAALVAACGDGSGNPMGPGASAGVTATIDGQAFRAVSAQAIRTGNIIGIGSADAQSTAIGFAFMETAGGTGTYPIGPTTVANGSVTIGTQSWTASAGNGGSGTITVTTLTATRVAGTFNFTAPALTGSPTPATRVVTNGSFDLEF